MRKYISIVLICIFMLSFAVSADEMDFLTAARAAAQKLDIPDNYTEFNSYTDIGDDTNYILSWSGGGSTDGGSVTVALDSKQRIVSYSRYLYGKYNGNYRLSSIDYSEACKIADEFLKKAVPEFYDSLVIFEQSNYILRNNDKYDILYYRYENGLPCYDNYAIVSVDAYIRSVTEYSAVWEDYAAVSSASSYISKQEALKSFDKNFGLQLAYSKCGSDITLVYSPNGDGTGFINAYTGEVTNTSLPPYDSAQKYTKKTELYDNLYPSENGRIPAMADSRLRENTYLGITPGHKMSGVAYYTDDEGNEFCEITYDKNSENPVTVTVDCDTYDTVRFSAARKKTENSKMITNVTCLKIASDYASKYIKNIYKSCKEPFIIPTNESNVCRIKFPLYVNGIPYNDNGIIIEVDRADGRIIYINAVREKNAEFPLSIPDISPGEAFERLVDKAGFEMMYVPVMSGGSKELRAVYWFSPVYPVFVNAQSGEMCSRDGKPYFKSGEKHYTDIEGTASQQQIETLVLAGIFRVDGDCFEPERKMTEAEFSKILSEVFKIETGIGGDGYITHEEAVAALVDALGYADAARLDAYIVDFIDAGSISPEYSGSAAVAKGLGIIRGNAFLPKEHVTRAYCAELIYNTMIGRTDNVEG